MTARTVTGNTVLLTGSAQASQTVTFVKRFATISGTVITQHGSTTTTTDASGDFSKALDCPASGSTSWTLVTPDGSEFDFTLPYGDGSSVAVTTLISAPTVDADAVMLLLDGYEPALGNPGTSGHVLSSTTAGVRSWVAQSGGGAVDSVFGRTGAVVAASGDYGTDEITDDSVYAKASLTAALDSIANDFSGLDGNVSTHTSDTNNPHSVTAAQVGAIPLDALILSKSGAYPLAAGDEGKIIECNGTLTITLPNGLGTGFQAVIVNIGSGVITLAATTTLTTKDSAVTLANQYGAATVYHAGSNIWRAFGDLS